MKEVSIYFCCNCLFLLFQMQWFVHVVSNTTHEVMVSRVAILLWVLESKLVWWLYEQFDTSMMWQHPRTQQLLKSFKVFRAHMHMGAYGSASPKPTHLWSPCAEVAKFSLPLPQDREWESMVTKKTLPDGRVQVTGNSSLKGSQTYPKQFGYATVRVWKTIRKREHVAKSKVPQVPCSELWRSKPKDCWKDADLTEVFPFLSLGTFKP